MSTGTLGGIVGEDLVGGDDPPPPAPPAPAVLAIACAAGTLAIAVG